MESFLKALTIPASEVNQGMLIGKGGFGEVYRGTYGPMDVVLKILIGAQDERESDKLIDELHFLWNARHDDIVLLHGFVNEPGRQAIVLEFAKYGALGSFLRDLPKHPPLSITVRVVKQLTNAMAFLHHELKPVMLHRDLKADNILVNAEFNAKLSDFGLSEYRAAVKFRSAEPIPDSTRVKDAGTASHVPPEKFETPTAIPSKTYDIYSYAITLWEILSRQNVYTYLAELNDFKAQIIGGYRPPDASLRPDCPEELKALMKRCWDREMTNRPYFEEIKSVLEDMTSTLMLAVSESDLKILETMANLKDHCPQNMDVVQVSAEDLPENNVNQVTLELSHLIGAVQGLHFYEVAVASAGAMFVATNQGLREYDSKGQEVSTPLTEGCILSVDVFSDGRVAAGLEDGSVTVLSRDEAQSPREWRVTATFKSKVVPRCLAVAKDDSCLSVAYGRWGWVWGRVLYIYSCSGRLLLEKALGYYIWSLASSAAAVVVLSQYEKEPPPADPVSSSDKRRPLGGHRVEAYGYRGQLLWQCTSSDRACGLCPYLGSKLVYAIVDGKNGVRVLRREGQQGTTQDIVSGSEALQQPCRMSMDRRATCLAVISGYDYKKSRNVTVFTVVRR